ncbi:MAG: site-2 protease family protein [Bdellovibrionales bacterium]
MNDVNLADTFGRALLYFVPFLFALCFHEFAHGWMAKRKGDNTAEIMGRLTLNPVVHADLFGTVILPFMALMFKFPFFGWAKPVPVNERNLKNPKKDMFWIALAGPMSNMLLAFVASFVFIFWLQFRPLDTGGVPELLKVFIMINLFLAVFNLIPLHPLDGGKVLARFLPDKVNDALEANQQTTMIMLMVLMVTGALKYLAMPVYFLAEFMFSVAAHVAGFIA